MDNINHEWALIVPAHMSEGLAIPHVTGCLGLERGGSLRDDTWREDAWEDRTWADNPWRDGPWADAPAEAPVAGAAVPPLLSQLPPPARISHSCTSVLVTRERVSYTQEECSGAWCLLKLECCILVHMGWQRFGAF